MQVERLSKLYLELWKPLDYHGTVGSERVKTMIGCILSLFLGNEGVKPWTGCGLCLHTNHSPTVKLGVATFLSLNTNYSQTVGSERVKTIGCILSLFLGNEGVKPWTGCGLCLHTNHSPTVN